MLGLPRGGVPVAAEVAAALGAPLDIVVVRKLGVPGRAELAMGALAEDGVRVLEESVLRTSRVQPEALAAVHQREEEVLAARVARLRGGRPPADLAGRVAVVVDDGLATGCSARAACLAVRERGAARVVLAVPVAPVGAADRFPEADEVVIAWSVERFRAVSLHYRDFTATTDDEVLAVLGTAERA